MWKCVDDECVSRWGQLFGGVSTLMNCEERLRQRGSLSHMSGHSHWDTHGMWQTLPSQTTARRYVPQSETARDTKENEHDSVTTHIEAVTLSVYSCPHPTSSSPIPLSGRDSMMQLESLALFWKTTTKRVWQNCDKQAKEIESLFKKRQRMCWFHPSQ